MKNLGTKTIETKRLILRKFTISDAENMYKNWAGDAEVSCIESRHNPLNSGSDKVMLKCGLKYEGTRIKADRNNTGICDVAMYGIINENR